MGKIPSVLLQSGYVPKTGPASVAMFKKLIVLQSQNAIPGHKQTRQGTGSGSCKLVIFLIKGGDAKFRV